MSLMSREALEGPLPLGLTAASVTVRCKEIRRDIYREQKEKEKKVRKVTENLQFKIIKWVMVPKFYN